MYRGKFSNHREDAPGKMSGQDSGQADATPLTPEGREARRQKAAQARIRRRRNRRIGLGVGLAVLALAVFLVVKSCGAGDETSPTEPPVTTEGSSQQDSLGGNDETDETTGATTEATEPYVMSTASVGVTGDILVHTPVINAAKNSDGIYDFHESYEFITDYYSAYDLMIANLEVTLGGTEAGNYTGYPIFNCPDTIIDALQAAGVDMVLTANNHMYDTGYNGLIRTQEVLNQEGMPYVGSQLTEDQPDYIIQDVNGIKIGMVCYTYETPKTSAGRKSLNGIPLAEKAEPLVNSFDYDDLETFYGEVNDVLRAMEAEGAEANMVFIHWGNEYQLKPNDYQQTIAQQLCELGVDVIVGGHPHVLQPFERLVSEDGHETYCVYSIGNAISNQRREKISSAPNGHTEDGMVFEVVFEKWSDGSVKLAELDMLPTWVNLERVDGEPVYTIVPLDVAQQTWDGYNVTDISETYESYNRIMEVVGQSLNECRAALGLDAVPVSVTEP